MHIYISYVGGKKEKEKTHIRLRTLRLTLLLKTLPNTESIPLILPMLRVREQRSRRNLRTRFQRVDRCNTTRSSGRHVLILCAEGGSIGPRRILELVLGSGFRVLRSRSGGLLDWLCSKWFRDSRGWVIVLVSRGRGLIRSNECLGRAHHECTECTVDRGWR